MLTILMNEGANKWRNDKKRTYLLIDEAQKFCNHPDLWKRAEYGRAKNHGRGLNGSVKKEKTRRDTAVSLATTTVGCACLSTYVRPHVAPLHCLRPDTGYRQPFPILSVTYTSLTVQ